MEMPEATSDTRTAFAVYLHDHLAGAAFALELLDDLARQTCSMEAAGMARELLPQIRGDRESLEQLAAQFSESPSGLKDAIGWLAQKSARLKLSLDEPLGVFEAVETLTLGVLGKLGLWAVVQQLQERGVIFSRLNLSKLIDGAHDQHARLEALRLLLADKAF